MRWGSSSDVILLVTVGGFECLPPKTQDLHGFFRRSESKISRSSNISIRDILMLVALTAVTFAVVRIGDFVAAAISFLFLAIFMLRAIVAFVADVEERLIAIGFIVPAAVYGFTLCCVRESEFAFGGNYLITSIGMSQMFNSITGETRDPYWQAQSMAAGHGLVAIYLGCAGSEFARSVHRSSCRNLKDTTNNPMDVRTGNNLNTNG